MVKLGWILTSMLGIIRPPGHESGLGACLVYDPQGKI